MNEAERPVRTDPASLELRERARAEGIRTVWDRYAALGSQCKVGELGICCTICHLGPCNLGVPGSRRPQVGVCGATIDTVAARRLARDMAAGSAAHSDHGRGVAHLLLLAARGQAPGYTIKDERKLRALAVSSARRSRASPETPTVAEGGLPGFESGSWFGIHVPATTPRAIIDKLNAEVNRILALPELRERFGADGAELVGGTPAEFGAFFRREIEKWAKVIKFTGMRVE